MLELAKIRKELYDKPVLKNLFLELTALCNARKTSSGSDKDIVHNMVDVARNLGQDTEIVTTVLAQTISERQKAIRSAEVREIKGMGSSKNYTDHQEWKKLKL